MECHVHNTKLISPLRSSRSQRGNALRKHMLEVLGRSKAISHIGRLSRKRYPRSPLHNGVQLVSVWECATDMQATRLHLARIGYGTHILTQGQRTRFGREVDDTRVPQLHAQAQRETTRTLAQASLPPQVQS